MACLRRSLCTNFAIHLKARYLLPYSFQQVNKISQTRPTNKSHNLYQPCRGSAPSYKNRSYRNRSSERPALGPHKTLGNAANGPQIDRPGFSMCRNALLPTILASTVPTAVDRVSALGASFADRAASRLSSSSSCGNKRTGKTGSVLKQ